MASDRKMLKQRIEQDLKTAMLAGESQRVSTLRGIKSAILYEEVSKNKRESGLGDEDLLRLLARESKKRQESADLYLQGGSSDRAKAELAEKSIIDSYLPEQLSDDELNSIVDQAIGAFGQNDIKIGQVISVVKEKVNGSADGSRIAQAVKARIGK